MALSISNRRSPLASAGGGKHEASVDSASHTASLSHSRVHTLPWHSRSAPHSLLSSHVIKKCDSLPPDGISVVFAHPASATNALNAHV